MGPPGFEPGSREDDSIFSRRDHVRWSRAWNAPDPDTVSGQSRAPRPRPAAPLMTPPPHSRAVEARLIALAVTVLLLPWATASAPEDEVPDAEVEVRYTPHASIRITSDAEFDAAHGVRSGSGTAEDPYVIADWAFIENAGYAVWISRTTAHVRIERILVEGIEGSAGGVAACLAGAECASTSSGIRLDGVTNVSIREMRTFQAFVGVRVEGSRNVTIEDVDLSNPAWDDARRAYREAGFGSADSGFWVLDSENVVIDTARTANVFFGMFADGNELLTVRESTFASDFGGWGIQLFDALDLTIQHNRFDVREDGDGLLANQVLLVGVTDADVSENEFVGGTAPFKASDVYGLRFCGNTVRSEDPSGLWAAVDIERSSDVTIVGNRFDDNAFAAWIGFTSGLNVTRNEFRDASVAGLVSQSVGAAIHQNLFAGNAAVWIIRDADARGNWWGDVSGPSGVGPGAGDPLVIEGAQGIATVPFEPWLTSPPDTSVDCIPGDSRGASSTPLTFSATARAAGREAGTGPVEVDA